MRLPPEAPAARRRLGNLRETSHNAIWRADPGMASYSCVICEDGSLPISCTSGRMGEFPKLSPSPFARALSPLDCHFLRCDPAVAYSYAIFSAFCRYVLLSWRSSKVVLTECDSTYRLANSSPLSTLLTSTLRVLERLLVH